MSRAKFRKRRLSRPAFAALMQYPQAWLDWGMFPEPLYRIQLAEYEPGSERAAEHVRYGAFGWWAARKPTHAQLLKLAILTWLDPDQLMARGARRELLKNRSLRPELRRLLSLRFR